MVFAPPIGLDSFTRSSTSRVADPHPPNQPPPSNQVLVANRHCAASGFTPLHWAAYSGHRELVRLLVERGAEVDARDERGQTALHVAAIWAQGDACETLMSVGADEMLKDAKAYTPEELAEYCGTKYRFKAARPEAWWATPLKEFPGVEAWWLCAERIRRAGAGRRGGRGGKRALEGGVEGEGTKRQRGEGDGGGGEAGDVPDAAAAAAADPNCMIGGVKTSETAAPGDAAGKAGEPDQRDSASPSPDEIGWRRDEKGCCYDENGLRVFEFMM